MFVTERLPPDILARATLRGREYAWALDDIPAVIEAARKAGLINVGGQLQFRAPGATCEIYYVEVDTYKSVPKTLPYEERVEKTAEAALREFTHLRETEDFIAEGRKGFADVLRDYEAQGGDLSDIVCFVWYVSDE